MDEGHKEQSSLISSPSIRAEGEGKEAPGEDRGGLVWVRDDGAICVGNECIVIKPEPGTKNLDIEIAPTKCGEATADLLLEHLLKTVGKGGNTRFTVKSELVEQ